MAEPPAKRRRPSGQRQRVSQILAEGNSSPTAEPQKKSLVAKNLLYKFAWGNITPRSSIFS
jgi:hypothetical protein